MKKFVIVLSVLLIGIIGVAAMSFNQEGIKIKVINQTNKEISGMFLTYDNIKSDVNIPAIAPGETQKLIVNTIDNSTEEFDEGALLLKYSDNGGFLHSDTVVGYIEKGYSGNAVIKIKSVHAGGTLELEIENNY